MSPNKGKVVSTNTSAEQGTTKQPLDQVQLDEYGIVGDAHAGPWHRQVSLLAQESIDRFAAEHKKQFKPGEFAENITTHGIDLRNVAVLDRFKIGQAELEVTQVGKACHGDGCAVYQRTGRCVMPKEGIFCRVIKGGIVRPGDVIDYRPKVLSFLVLTVSDRASRGEYEDRSGPEVRRLLEEFFKEKRWHINIENAVISDDAPLLERKLREAREAGTDVVITTGGTGIGPRDITPDVVMHLADKTIPGIMEDIRIKFGQDKPNALLSRSVTATLGQMLVYTLPGSVRAVREYMGELLKTIEHLILMLHGIDAHGKH